MCSQNMGSICVNENLIHDNFQIVLIIIVILSILSIIILVIFIFLTKYFIKSMDHKNKNSYHHNDIDDVDVNNNSYDHINNEEKDQQSPLPPRKISQCDLDMFFISDTEDEKSFLDIKSYFGPAKFAREKKFQNKNQYIYKILFFI